MATLTKPQYRLLTISSCLGILQGIAWFVMSLICIILYLDSINSVGRLAPDSQSYMENLEWATYMYLLWGNSPANTIITPHSFTIFMWIYLLATAMWVTVSVLQLRAINQISANPINLMKCWGALTCLISLIDFLLVVLLGAEHAEYCLPSIPDILSEAVCTNVLITVLIIAARGFVLWIVNVIFVYVTYRIMRTIQAGKSLGRKLLSVDQTIPRASLYTQPRSNRRSNQPTPTSNTRSSQPTPTSHQSNNMWSNQPTTTLHSNGSGSAWSNQPGSPPANNNNASFWHQEQRPTPYEARMASNNPGYFGNQQPPFSNNKY